MVRSVYKTVDRLARVPYNERINSSHISGVALLPKALVYRRLRITDIALFVFIVSVAMSFGLTPTFRSRQTLYSESLIFHSSDMRSLNSG